MLLDCIYPPLSFLRFLTFSKTDGGVPQTTQQKPLGVEDLDPSKNAKSFQIPPYKHRSQLIPVDGNQKSGEANQLVWREYPMWNIECFIEFHI